MTVPWGSRVDARGAGGADLRRIRIPPLPRAVSIPKAIATPAASARLSDSVPLPSGLHLASPLRHVHIHLLRFRRKANTRFVPDRCRLQSGSLCFWRANHLISGMLYVWVPSLNYPGNRVALARHGSDRWTGMSRSRRSVSVCCMQTGQVLARSDCETNIEEA